MMALVVALQAFVVISPPERSLAFSSNHILNGVKTKNDLLAAYDNPNSDIKDIFTRFNLSRADIAALPNTPNVTIRSNDGSDWWTTGRTSLWNYGNVADVYKRGEVPVQYRGQGTATKADDAYIYARGLRAWDIVNPYNTYSAFKGKSSATGQEFWIIADCGNITWKGNWQTPPPAPKPPAPAPNPTPTPTPAPPTPTPTPTPPPAPLPQPPKPELEIKKSISTTRSVLNPGETFTYKIAYRNKVIGSVAQNVYIEDQLDTKNFDVITPNNLTINNGFLRQSIGDLRGTETARVLEIPVRLKNPLPSGTRICNTASIVASNAQKVTSRPEVCIDVITPCPYDPTIPNINNPNCVNPVVVCELVDAAVNLSTRIVNFKTTVSSTNPANTTVYSYSYDFGDGSTKVTNQSSALTNEQQHTYRAGEFTAKVIISYATRGSDGRKEISCTSPISFEEDQALGQAKTVRNITQNLEGENAEKSAVKAGDVLEYTLQTTNTQNYEPTLLLATTLETYLITQHSISQAYEQLAVALMKQPKKSLGRISPFPLAEPYSRSFASPCLIRSQQQTDPHQQVVISTVASPTYMETQQHSAYNVRL
jgi:hypothetical protein